MNRLLQTGTVSSRHFARQRLPTGLVESRAEKFTSVIFEPLQLLKIEFDCSKNRHAGNFSSQIDRRMPP